MAHDLTAEAREGYDAELTAQCPYYATSNCADAWYVGAYFKRANMDRPAAVRHGRGYRVHANGNLWLVTYDNRAGFIVVTPAGATTL